MISKLVFPYFKSWAIKVFKFPRGLNQEVLTQKCPLFTFHILRNSTTSMFKFDCKCKSSIKIRLFLWILFPSPQIWSIYSLNHFKVRYPLIGIYQYLLIDWFSFMTEFKIVDLKVGVSPVIVMLKFSPIWSCVSRQKLTNFEYLRYSSLLIINLSSLRVEFNSCWSWIKVHCRVLKSKTRSKIDKFEAFTD